MKISSIFIATFFSLFILQVHAQTEAPKGFKKGSITIADGSQLPGFVKDNIRNDASITFLTEAGTNKKTYNGNDLLSAEIEGVKYTCIKGDFFKVLCEGELCFLQKSSDVSGKIVYSGNEAILLSGTEGKLNDYFIYNKDKQLIHVSKKNVNEVAADCFAGHNAAIEKAKTINGDLSQIKEAVEMYNKETK